MGRHKRGFDMGDLRGVGTFAVIVLVVIVIIMFLILYGPAFGFTDAMSKSLINVFPFIFALMISLFLLTKSSDSPIFVVAAFGGIGVSVAFLLNALHNEGYLTDAMLAPASIQQCMFWSVIVCLIIGAAVGTAVMKK
jgi:hypothetical protein